MLLPGAPTLAWLLAHPEESLKGQGQDAAWILSMCLSWAGLDTKMSSPGP